MSALLAADGRLRAIWRFVLSVGAVYAANSFAAAIAFRIGRPESFAFEVVYRPALAAFLVLGFSLLLLLADRAAKPLPAMGLGLPGRGDAVAGLLIGGSMVVVAAACIAVAGELDFSAVLSARVAGRVLAVIFILATAALAEELAFRGYPFQRLIESLGPGLAVVLMSVPFGAVHLSNPHSSIWAMSNTILIGALLCVAYLRTWKLWLPFGIHLGWNATLGLVLGLPVSGLTEFSVVVKGRAHGPVWLTGGSYGIEAGAVGTVAIVLGFLALIAFVPQQPAPKPVEPEPPPLFESPLEITEPSAPSESTPDGATPPDTHPSE